MPLPYDAEGNVVEGEAPRLFIAYVNGSRAQRLDRLPDSAAARQLLDDLARLRPATRGALQFIAAVSWQKDRYSGGAYASWAPGQCARLAPALLRPDHHLFFAGEHTAIASRGMEGALESAERIAVQIVTALG